jgi:hypothetical protein
MRTELMAATTTTNTHLKRQAKFINMRHASLAFTIAIVR